MVRMNDHVAVVTGAGGGLGRAYCLHLASLGAKVVVNDLGVSLQGDLTKTENPADKVVREIKEKGGQAIANYDNVLEGEKIIQAAINAFGKITILVNNAGNLKDTSFIKMNKIDFVNVINTHLIGTFHCTKAAWPYFLKQKFGRVVNTTSASGLYGNFGQANYSAAKMGIIGLTKTLSQEGKAKNIYINAVAPLAGTRMTETVMPMDLVKALKPEYVAPVVAYLCSAKCNITGEIFEVGAGWVSNVKWHRTKGHVFTGEFTLEDVDTQIETIMKFDKDATYPNSLQDSILTVSEQVMKESNPEKERTDEKKRHNQ